MKYSSHSSFAIKDEKTSTSENRRFSKENVIIPSWNDVDPSVQNILKGDIKPIHNIFMKRKMSQKSTDKSKFLNKHRKKNDEDNTKFTSNPYGPFISCRRDTSQDLIRIEERGKDELFEH